MDQASTVNAPVIDTWKILYISATIIIVMCIKKLLTKPQITAKPVKQPNKQKSEALSKESTKSKESAVSTTGKNKKKPSENRRTGRGDKQTFNHPWLLTSLKGHSAPVLDIDFSSDGKYLASCGEDTLDPGGEGTSSSGSECNKENSRPSSAEPHKTKTLSRRQRKNRRSRDDTASSSSSPEITKKKHKKSSTKQRTSKSSKMYLTSNLYAEDENQPSDANYAHRFRGYILNVDEMVTLGYPVESAYFPGRAIIYKSPGAYQPKCKVTNRFDVNAREFVPRVMVNGHDNLHAASINYSDINAGWNAGHDTLSADSGQGSGTSSPLSIETEGGDLHDVVDVGAPLFPRRGGGITEERNCVRCGRGFFVGPDGEYLTQEHCVYHWGKFHKVSMPRYGAAAQYTCCKGDEDSVGCTKGRLHVWNGLGLGFNGPLEGFVQTKRRKCVPTDGNYGVYALDCEMCYTYGGLELAKLTVVGLDGRVVYDTFVRPEHEVIDYNTRFSGVTAKDLSKKGSAKILRDVQSDLMGFISADTILVGHGLENDLRALKMIHRTIVDTAVTFPHYRGLPFKHSLKALTACYLRREIQCAGSQGHDSMEDARACLDLMIYRVARDFGNTASY